MDLGSRACERRAKEGGGGDSTRKRPSEKLGGGKRVKGLGKLGECGINPDCTVSVRGSIPGWGCVAVWHCVYCPLDPKRTSGGRPDPEESRSREHQIWGRRRG